MLPNGGSYGNYFRIQFKNGYLKVLLSEITGIVLMLDFNDFG